MNDLYRPTFPNRRIPARWTDAELASWVKQAADAVGEPLAHGAYDAYAKPRGGPSYVRIFQRFGSWTAACEQAGVRPARTRLAGRRQYSDRQVLDSLHAYLNSQGATGTAYGYSDWAQEQSNRPCLQLVRNRYGTWNGAKAAARADLRRGAA